MKSHGAKSVVMTDGHLGCPHQEGGAHLPSIPHTEDEIASMQAAAGAIGRKVLVLRARTENDIEAAFAEIERQRAGAVAVGNSALFNSRRDQLARNA